MLQLYSIKNKEQKIFGKPMAFTDETHCLHSTRKFFIAEELAEELDASNFEIYHVGEFEEKTGKITSRKKIQLIMNCSNLIQKTPIKKPKKKVRK